MLDILLLDLRRIETLCEESKRQLIGVDRNAKEKKIEAKTEV